MHPGVLVAVDSLVVAGWAVAVGATAPRWPDRWTAADGRVLRVRRWESPALYRGLGAARLARVLPEGGTWSGGSSKSRLGGTGTPALAAYAVEVRRAQLVHLAGPLAVLALPWFNPWPLTAAFAAAVAAGNAPFLLVLRHNHVRLARVLARRAQAGGGQGRAAGGGPGSPAGAAGPVGPPG